MLVVYEVHRFGGFGGRWQAEVLDVMRSWADPAIAIVVVTWLGDIATATFTER